MAWGHFPDETTMKRSATVRLLFFALAILLVPLALNHALPSKTPFNRQPLERLRAARPSIVLIGDSLVHAAIDPQLLQKELRDGKVEMIWRGGAASAAWYLSLKFLTPTCAGCGITVSPRSTCRPCMAG